MLLVFTRIAVSSRVTGQASCLAVLSITAFTLANAITLPREELLAMTDRVSASAAAYTIAATFVGVCFGGQHPAALPLALKLLTMAAVVFLNLCSLLVRVARTDEASAMVMLLFLHLPFTCSVFAAIAAVYATDLVQQKSARLLVVLGALVAAEGVSGSGEARWRISGAAEEQREASAQPPVVVSARTPTAVATAVGEREGDHRPVAMEVAPTCTDARRSRSSEEDYHTDLHCL